MHVYDITSIHFLSLTSTQSISAFDLYLCEIRTPSLVNFSDGMFLTVRGGACCTHHHSCEVNTHGIPLLWAQHWSPDSVGGGGAKSFRVLDDWYSGWAFCWDCQRLSMAAQWKCYDWPHQFPECVLIGWSTRIPCLKLRQSAGFAVSGEYYSTYILIKAEISMYPHLQVFMTSHTWILIKAAL